MRAVDGSSGREVGLLAPSGEANWNANGDEIFVLAVGEPQHEIESAVGEALGGLGIDLELKLGSSGGTVVDHRYGSRRNRAQHLAGICIDLQIGRRSKNVSQAQLYRNDIDKTLDGVADLAIDGKGAQ